MKFASDGWVKLSERAEKAEQDAAEARASLERERKARHAAERVNADEVLRKRTNLEARIEAAEMERDEAVARAKAAEARNRSDGWVRQHTDEDRAEALTTTAGWNYDCNHPGMHCNGCSVKIDGAAMLTDLREAGWDLVRA